MSSDTFHGWAAVSKDKPLEWMELPLRAPDDDTVDMKITHCGICGSDIHTQDSGWGETDYPCVTGHEITGICTAVGKNVKHIKVGDRIGVGAQSGSCLECKECLNGEENLCQGRKTGTYNSRWPNGDKAFGGYADKWRGHQRFVFKVPDNMTNEVAATFFCAGVTTYSPLKRYGVTKGSKVGVIGLGGLGHYAIQWAKAMGAHVVTISRSDKKLQDATALGSHEYINASNPDELKAHTGTFTHIICTAYSKEFDWPTYFRLMDTNSYFIMVALPEAPLNGIPAMLLAARQISLVGSMIGSPSMIEEMLQFAAEHDVKPWISKYPMKQCNEAVQAFRDGKPRYRIVLENE
ncbi:hypothetical protein RMATCC62417_14918 [Rhizopus microsporus]|nr:hypothetical protein RMATCC62417_14918 [Rhizopus microsporus]